MDLGQKVYITTVSFAALAGAVLVPLIDPMAVGAAVYFCEALAGSLVLGGPACIVLAVPAVVLSMTSWTYEGANEDLARGMAKRWAKRVSATHNHCGARAQPAIHVHTPEDRSEPRGAWEPPLPAPPCLGRFTHFRRGQWLMPTIFCG